MATRRDFLIRGVGSTIGLAAGGLAWQTFAQEEAGALARNMKKIKKKKKKRK